MPFIKPHSTPIHSQRLAVIYTMALILHKRYDPWGVRKDPVTWDTDFSAGGSITARGYTMHEHLDDFGLINMLVRPKQSEGGLVRSKRSGGGNGRIYDPLLGRFLSPDNNIQAPGNPQNYNRYSYVLNNPLKYTDPSGEVPMFAIVAAAYANAAIQITSGNVNNGWEFFGAAAVGAASGYAGGAAFQTVGTALGTANSFGGAMANGVISGAAGSGAGGFVSGAGNAWMNGASFSQGLNAGFSMAAKGMISGGIIGGITGGIGHGLNNRIQNKTFFSGEHKDHGLLAYQYTVDANSGAINRISDLGGAKTHFYHVGYATDMPPAFVQTMAQAIVVDGENTINSFRIWQSLNANISAFSIPNAGVTGYFLEPNGPSTTMRNTGRRIPGGTYKLTPNNASYPNDFIVYNDKVPADRGITIHQGAYPDHTEGCLIPGAKWSSTEPAVYYSTDKLPQIRSFINESGYRNVRLNIYYAF